MARKTVYLEEEFLIKACEFVRLFGIHAMNARSLCKYIGCSTGPLFKIFINMDNLKKKLKLYLHNIYDDYIAKFVDKKDYLYTISYAYAFFAVDESNIFNALFMSDLTGTRTIDEVLKSLWNIPTIEAAITKYKISKEDAEKLYRDVRFYTHGLSSQLACHSINIEKEEIKKLIKNIIEKLLG